MMSSGRPARLPLTQWHASQTLVNGGVPTWGGRADEMGCAKVATADQVGDSTVIPIQLRKGGAIEVGDATAHRRGFWRAPATAAAPRALAQRLGCREDRLLPRVESLRPPRAAGPGRPQGERERYEQRDGLAK